MRTTTSRILLVVLLLAGCLLLACGDGSSTENVAAGNASEPVASSEQASEPQSEAEGEEGPRIATVAAVIGEENGEPRIWLAADSRVTSREALLNGDLIEVELESASHTIQSIYECHEPDEIDLRVVLKTPATWRTITQSLRRLASNFIAKIYLLPEGGDEVCIWDLSYTEGERLPLSTTWEHERYRVSLGSPERVWVRSEEDLEGVYTLMEEASSDATTEVWFTCPDQMSFQETWFLTKGIATFAAAQGWVFSINFTRFRSSQQPPAGFTPESITLGPATRDEMIPGPPEMAPPSIRPEDLFQERDDDEDWD